MRAVVDRETQEHYLELGLTAGAARPIILYREVAMRAFFIFLVALTGCFSPQPTEFERRKTVLNHEVELLRLEVRKERLTGLLEQLQTGP